MEFSIKENFVFCAAMCDMAVTVVQILAEQYSWHGFIFFFKTRTFMEVSYILKDVRSKRKKIQTTVTKCFDTFSPLGIVSILPLAKRN